MANSEGPENVPGSLTPWQVFDGSLIVLLVMVVEPLWMCDNVSDNNDGECDEAYQICECMQTGGKGLV